MTENDYRFRYKSGQIEVLSRKKGDRSFLRAEIERLYTANGRTLEFTWQPYGNDRRLSSISEGSHVVVAFDYGERVTTIICNPNTPQACTYSLLVQGERLDRFATVEVDEMVWKFDYTEYAPMYCLSEVVSPSSLLERINHRSGTAGQRMPTGAPYASLPNVSRHTVLPAQGQPAVVTEYEYSSTNFLGHGTPVGWTGEGDNLYLTSADYTYHTTLSLCGQMTKYTYNKYHLETESVQTKGRKSVTRKTTYHDKTNQPFDKQDAFYLLPKEVTTTYADGDTGDSRVEATLYTYDNAGNPLVETQPEGRKITRTYYPAKGETDFCPPDPWGFVRHLKEETITPAESEHAAPTLKRIFTYRSLPTVAGAPGDYFVVANDEHSWAGTTELTSKHSFDGLGRVPSLTVGSQVLGSCQ